MHDNQLTNVSLVKNHPERSRSMTGMFVRLVMLCGVLYSSGSVNALDQLCTNEGNATQIDGAIYQCLNGSLILALGCASDKGVLADGQTVKTDSYFYQCQRVGTSGAMQMVTIACIKDGKVLAPNQTYISNSVWYTCKMNSDSNLVLETSGCIGQVGEKVPLDETLAKGVYVFKCILNEFKPELVPYGCLYNSRTYKFSEAVHVGQFWYSCEKVGNDGIQLQLKGCLDETAHLLPGDVFHSHGFIFKCEKVENGMRRSGVGCLEVTAKKTIVEHSFGDQWVEGHSGTKYVMQCNQDKTGVAKLPVQCSFQNESDAQVISLKPGCIMRNGNVLWQCKKTDKGGLRSLVTQNPTPEDESKAIIAGFQYC